MEKWETANANEKILLSQEMVKMKDTLSEREKRMHSEISQLRKEKENLFEKITAIDTNKSEDIAKLQILINELKGTDAQRSQKLANENTHLLEVSKNLQSKLVTETAKDKVKLNKKPVDKMPVKAKNFLTPLRTQLARK